MATAKNSGVGTPRVNKGSWISKFGKKCWQSFLTFLSIFSFDSGVMFSTLIFNPSITTLSFEKMTP